MSNGVDPEKGIWIRYKHIRSYWWHFYRPKFPFPFENAFQTPFGLFIKY